MTSPITSSSSSTSSQPIQQQTLSGNALSYLTLLLNVIEQRDWATFSTLALQHQKALRTLSYLVVSSEEFNGMTFLHAVVRQHPPLTVVDELVRILPDLPSRVDVLNRTALHVACGVGASVQIIKYLVIAYPPACKIQDHDGRTPLHFCCDVDCRLFEGDSLRRDPPSFPVVHALLSGSISAASMEDEDEMSPLEYAITSDAEVKVVKLLQKAAQKHMKQVAAEKKTSCGTVDDILRTPTQPGAAA